MNDLFRCCSRPRVDGPDTYREYGCLRCVPCRRKSKAAAMRRARAKWVAEHGHATA